MRINLPRGAGCIYWSYCNWLMMPWCGVFRNRPDIIPGRWGFYLLGLEIGSRNPGNWFGVWLKEHWLWPW